MLTAHQSHIALGSTTEIVLHAEASPKAVEAMFRELWLLIFTFEKSFSRFLPASELSSFNRSAGVKQPITPEFRKVLVAASLMATLTDGMYNPFILPALQRAGYVHSFVEAHRNDEVDDFSNRSVVTPDKLEVGDTWARIPYGTAIDLGGCGKGYLGDRLAEAADNMRGLRGCWFSLGGDIVAGGCDAAGEPWAIGIENTADSSGPSAGSTLASLSGHTAVATSSITQRKGVHAGQRWHHIIDPRTNRPARAAHLTATVRADSGLVADVLASCLLLLGNKRAIQFALAKGANGVLLQEKTGAVTAWGSIVKGNPD